MKVVALVLQILIAVVIVALTMPVLLATMPPLQDDRVGPAVAFGLAATAFGLIRLAWPKRRH